MWELLEGKKTCPSARYVFTDDKKIQPIKKKNLIIVSRTVLKEA